MPHGVAKTPSQNSCQLITKSIQNGLDNACTYISPYLSLSLQISLILRFDKEFQSFRLLCECKIIVTPIVGVCNCSMFCCTLLYVHSSIAIILMGKRELIALLNLSSWCLLMVERLFLAVPRGCLQFVIVVFPDHTHLLFLFF